MSPNTWLVTGTSGLIGNSVVQTLHAMLPGHRIIAAGRRERTASVVGVKHFGLDLLSPLPELPPGIGTVLHLAGNKQDETHMQAVNHHGTRRLVEVAERAGVRRFIYVSSVGVYGAPRHSSLVNESFPHTPQNRYEISKDEGEACVREVCARAGMEYVILQPSNVIGMVKGRSYPLLGLMRMICGGYFMWFGTTEPWVNYVAVEDVSAAIVFSAMRAPSGQTYIINTPAQLSHVVGWIAEELGVAQPHRRLPLWVGQTVALLGSAATRVSGRAMPINRERFTALTNTTLYDPTYLMKSVQFEYPNGIEFLIRSLVRTYRRDGLL